MDHFKVKRKNLGTLDSFKTSTSIIKNKTFFFVTFLCHALFKLKKVPNKNSQLID